MALAILYLLNGAFHIHVISLLINVIQKSLKLNYFHSIKLAEKRQNAATSMHHRIFLGKNVAILSNIHHVCRSRDQQNKKCDLQGRGRLPAIIHEFAMQKRHQNYIPLIICRVVEIFCATNSIPWKNKTCSSETLLLNPYFKKNCSGLSKQDLLACTHYACMYIPEKLMDSTCLEVKHTLYHLRKSRCINCSFHARRISIYQLISFFLTRFA